MNIIKIDKLNFSYGNLEVFRDLNFNVKKNEFVTLIGENGAGKSTLLKLILSNLKNYNGRIELFGEDIRKNSSVKRIAYISQNAVSKYKFFPTTVEEVLKIHLKYLKSKKEFDILLENMELNKHKKNKLSELSGGQLQRLAILIALIKEAELIVFDEATSGVDKNFTSKIYKMLKEMNKTVLIVTHNLTDLLKWVDSVYEIKNKEIGYADSIVF